MQGLLLSPEAAKQVADTVRRVARMPHDAQQYTIPQRRVGTVVHVVQVTSDTPNANGLYSGVVKIYSTPDGDEVNSQDGEDCLIFNVN